jgi:hypothetical protein
VEIIIDDSFESKSSYQRELLGGEIIFDDNFTKDQLSQFLKLLVKFQNVQLDDEVDDDISQKLSANGQCLTKSHLSSNFLAQSPLFCTKRGGRLRPLRMPNSLLGSLRKAAFGPRVVSKVWFGQIVAFVPFVSKQWNRFLTSSSISLHRLSLEQHIGHCRHLTTQLDKSLDRPLVVPHD